MPPPHGSESQPLLLPGGRSVSHQRQTWWQLPPTRAARMLIKQACCAQESAGEGRPGAPSGGGEHREEPPGMSRAGSSPSSPGPPCAPTSALPSLSPLLPRCCAVLSRSVVSDSATPWTIARQAPLSMGILQARTLECVFILTPSPSPQGFTTFLSLFPVRGGPCILPSSPPSPEAGSWVLKSSGLGGGEGLILCLRKF